MNNIDKEAFERWWHEEGSGMLRYNDEDVAEWVHRMAEIAWMNGAGVARGRMLASQVETLRRNMEPIALERAMMKVLPHQAERAKG